MEVIYTILLLIFGVIIANFLAQRWNFFPRAIWQILAGVLIALVPAFSGLEVKLDPEWFMALIVAPLLFCEGQQTNGRVFSKNFRTILSLAGVLAVLVMTLLTLTMKLTLAWSWGAALALAAIITPTDATALGSVKNGFEMPLKVEHRLTLESMFNDATGLVGLQLASVVVLTGHLSPLMSVGNFLMVSIGGGIFGIGVTFLLIQMRKGLLKRRYDDITSHVLLQLFTPLVIYVAAENLHLSGVIAVVMAGIFHHEEQERTLLVAAQMNNLLQQLWSLLTELLNGIVFVILGVSLVPIFSRNLVQRQWLLFLGLSMGLYLLMTFIRFVFELCTLSKKKAARIKNSLIFALGGVHGTVTLAMALTVPLMLKTSKSTTWYDNLVTLAALVILISLFVPLIFLRFLLKKEAQAYTEAELAQARTEIVNAAFSYINELETTGATKERLRWRVKTQLGYDAQKFPEQRQWQQMLGELQRQRDTAVQQAVDAGSLNEDGLVLWNKLKQFNLALQGKERIEKGFLKRFLIRNKRWLVRIFLRWTLNFEKGDQRLQTKLARLERQVNRTTSVRRKHKLQLKIEKYAKKIAFYKKYTDRNRTEQWRSNLQQLQQILAPVDNNFIAAKEQAGTDQQLLIALKQLVGHEATALQQQFEAPVQENTELLKVLNFELAFLNEARTNESGINPAVIKHLADELISAQSILIAV